MHPYRGLPARQYWRSAAAAWHGEGRAALYTPKFAITRETRIATAGSCFAQHIGRQLRGRGYRYLDFEPAPEMLPAERHAAHGYGLYSARYGNIYSSRQLMHLVQAAYGSRRIAEVWESDGRFHDPMRPAIEPGGFGSREEVERLRQGHLAAIRAMMEGVDLFVFTLGLTEIWENAEDGLAYPVCPGTVAGRFDPARHRFRNLRHAEVLQDMQRVINWWRGVNPGIRFLLTVSPVPLAATALPRHVVASTTYSKSVLRAVAGELADAHDAVDYFPSYELVTAPLARGAGYEPGMREVRPEAVEAVMAVFFAAHGDGAVPATPTAENAVSQGDAEMARRMEVVCEEARLDEGALP
ncbi:GSCFA domain-containing protein [Muricoccus radiodurans]|uniref:GSCFA domain-containing protein n=1 Tax=Muricoccus radiodurans TaxID=2231721 RepID=UPI003CF0A55A